MNKFLIILSFICWSGAVYAHESRPLFIEVIEQQPGVFLLQYKVPASIPVFNVPEVLMPEGFTPLAAQATYNAGQGVLKSQQYKSDHTLYGLEIGMKYPVMNPSVSSIIKVQLLNGMVFRAVLGPEQLTWTIPEEESFWGVAGQYTVLAFNTFSRVGTICCFLSA